MVPIQIQSPSSRSNVTSDGSLNCLHLLIKVATREVSRPSRMKEAKPKTVSPIQNEARNWMDRRRSESLAYVGFQWSHPPLQQEQRDRNRQMYDLKRNTDVRSKNSYHPEFHSADCSRSLCTSKIYRFAAAAKIATAAGLRIKSGPSYHSDLAVRDPMREEIWQSWWSDNSKWNTWSSRSHDKWRET